MRTNFLDRKEFDGPIDMQLEDAYAFLLRHLNMGKMKPERVERFKELLALTEQYRRKNQWE